MNIHKFNVKPKTSPPKMIEWRPLPKVKYPARKVNSMTWGIFSQEDIISNEVIDIREHELLCHVCYKKL